jgi:hypothetical protein
MMDLRGAGKKREGLLLFSFFQFPGSALHMPHVKVKENEAKVKELELWRSELQPAVKASAMADLLNLTALFLSEAS